MKTNRITQRQLQNITIKELVELIPLVYVDLKYKNKEFSITVSELIRIMFEAGYNCAFRKLKDR